MEEMRKAAQKAGESKTQFDVHRWTPDYAYWFLHKDAEAEREDFFGYGGLFSLLLKPDPVAHPPMPAIPRIMRTHPAYSGKMEEQYKQAQSLKDPFLPQSKEVFGEPFREDPSYDGLCLCCRC